MKSFALVKLIRATGKDTTDVTHSYEILTHNMNGSTTVRLDVKDGEKNREYCKTLKMRGERHAIRYLNTHTYVTIPESEYEERLAQWKQE
jgi:hypothetical protein